MGAVKYILQTFTLLPLAGEHSLFGSECRDCCARNFRTFMSVQACANLVAVVVSTSQRHALPLLYKGPKLFSLSLPVAPEPVSMSVGVLANCNLRENHTRLESNSFDELSISN